MIGKTLLDSLRETSDEDYMHEQGGGNSILLMEAAQEIQRLRDALSTLLLQVENCDGTAQIDIGGAKAALTDPPRL